MLNWREIPFVRLLFPFLIGLGMGIQFDLPLPWLPYFLLFIFLLLLLLAFRSIAYNFRWVYGALIHLLLLGFGYQLTIDYHELRQEGHFEKYLAKENYLLAQITEFPKAGERINVRAKVLGLSDVENSQGEWQEATGNLVLFLESHPEYADLRYGDQVLLRGKAHRLRPAANPEAFDYQRFQHFQNTHYQTFAKKEQWKIVSRDHGNPFLSQAFRLRSHFLQILKKYLPTEAEYGVASALILGNKSALTPEVKTAYASTGATHVLAVSGLHVGFIYLGLSFLLGLIRVRHKYWALLKTAIMIAGVWAFAFITGASPSVLRAATMFSFIILGSTLHRHTNIYNTLALSAFLLLCINPYLIAEVGFQLSYLAVLGIVSFQAWIYRLWMIDSAPGDYIWKLISVSLAAQLTTFPITLYYFHQFPFYFWLSGLIVVPAAMLILSGGVLLFVVESLLPFLAPVVGYLLYWVIWIMNALVYFIEQMPAALLQGLWIGMGGMLLLYFILSGLTYLFWRGKKNRVLAALASLCLVLGAIAWQSFERHQQKEMVIYQLSQHSMIDLVDGRELLSISSTDLEEKSINFAAQNYRWKKGIQKKSEINLMAEKVVGDHWYYDRGFLQFFNTKLGIHNGAPKQEEGKPIEFDYVLIIRNPKIDIEKIHQSYPQATLLADGSNRPWAVASWEQDCQRLNIPFVNLHQSGAHLIHLN